MSQNDNFMIQQQQAVERMMEMNRRSVPRKNGGNMPPAPSFVQLPQRSEEKLNQHAEQENQHPPAEKTTLQKSDGFPLPFLNDIKMSRDTTLILGLLLILYSEKADRFLLMALLYILL